MHMKETPAMPLQHITSAISGTTGINCYTHVDNDKKNVYRPVLVTWFAKDNNNKQVKEHICQDQSYLVARI